MKFKVKCQRILADADLYLLKDNINYDEICSLYIDNEENNSFLKAIINDYDFSNECGLRRKFINILVSKLSSKNLLGQKISDEFRDLIHKKIREIFLKPSIKRKYLEFDAFFKLSPKIDEVVKIEENFDLDHYLYGFFLRYYFSEKDYDRFCESLKIYLNKYFADSDDDKFFILGDSDYESWFKISKIANTFLEYFINNFEYLIILINRYQIHADSIELLCKNASSDLAKQFLKLLFSEYFYKHNFNLKSHIRGEQLEKIVKTQNDDCEFGKYIFDKISSGEFQAFDIGFYVLKGIITEDNIEQFFGYNWEDYIILYLYNLYAEEDNIEQKIYKKYKKIIDNNKQRNEQYRALERKNKLEKEKEIKGRIRILIKENSKNKKKKYPCREIIYLYNDYPDLFSEEEIEFVKNNIEFYFSCDEINLRNVQTEVEQQGKNSFRIPRFLRDLVLCVKLTEKLGINLGDYVGLLIGFIPYLYESELNIILNTLLKNGVTELGNDDIEWLINIYLNNRHRDLSKFQNTRIPYLISKGFINFSELDNQQKKKIFQIYKNKIEDNENVEFREKKIFLESILEIGEFDNDWLYNQYGNIFQQFINYNYYEDYLYGNIEAELLESYEKFLKLNEILIVLYKDKSCIKRRLKQLKGIKTDYVWERGKSSSFTARDNEIFRSNSKNERFYMCLVNAINYPEYLIEIKKILHVAKRFANNEESYMRLYIYDFCFEYFKKVPSNKQLNQFLEIHDDIFIKRYLFKIMNEKNKIEYEISEMDKLYMGSIHDKKKLKECNKKIGDLYRENQLLKKENWTKDIEIDKTKYENELLKQQIKKNSPEIFLYVEGKYDKYYIDYAFSQLKRFNSLNINVINCCGAKNISTIIDSYISENKTGIHIGIFDFDAGGIDAWCNGICDYYFNNNSNMWNQTIVLKKIFENKYKNSLLYKTKYSFYSLILLPYTENFKHQIFIGSSSSNILNDNSPKSLLINNKVFYDDCSKPIFTIEHLLYCKETQKYFKDVPVIGGGFAKIIETKKGLYEYVKKNKDLPVDIRENFSPIFEYVQGIVEEFTKKSNT